MILASSKKPSRIYGFGLSRVGSCAGALASVAMLTLSGCVSTGSGNMTLDFGEVLAKDQQTFTVQGERAALRRYVNDSYDIKLYGQSKVVDLDLNKPQVSVANVAEVSGATLITLDAPEAGCNHVYYVYQVAGTQSKKWQTSYRSCEGPLTFSVNKGQWTAHQSFKPSVGAPYMLVYQDGNLYTRSLTVSKPTAPKNPVKRVAKPAADNAANLGNVAGPAGTNLDDVAAPSSAANLDEIEVPTGAIKTKGLKADQATSVKMKDE